MGLLISCIVMGVMTFVWVCLSVLGDFEVWQFVPALFTSESIVLACCWYGSLPSHHVLG